MSAKKQSAFAIFKNVKTNSFSDMQSPSTTMPKVKKSPGAKSQGAMPSNNGRSLTAVLTKALTPSSNRKKRKAEAKAAKQNRSAQGGRLSCMPDSAISSPLVGGKHTELRPNTASNNAAANGGRYPLPFKPDMSGRGDQREDTFSVTPEVLRKPPVPQRKMSTKSMDVSAVSQGKAGKKRRPGNDGDSSVNTSRTSSQKSSKRNTLSPPKPAKRRRVNSNQQNGSFTKSSSSAPKQLVSVTSKHAIVEGAREHREEIPAHPNFSETDAPYFYDSQQEAKRLFDCMIHPVKAKKFFAELWEEKPLLVKRHMATYNDGWFSCEELDRIMRNEPLQFGTNIDVVTYTNGKRETLNPPGRAYSALVWDHYQNGCSVRLLNPQTYSKKVWNMLSTLQEYFNCMVGANVYLTPPGTQGFAPHYDDIEAFILQLEGKKHWRLYSPRTENEHLARHSSSNFTDQDIGDPILDVILEAGDLLYFPKGTIHQGRTLEDDHSLHITVSCQQLNSWGDFLEKLVPRALQLAIDEDVDFRRSLPRDYFNYMGIAFSDSTNPARSGFMSKIQQLMLKLASYCPVDAAVDQMAVKFQHDSLPPMLQEEEMKCSIHGHGEFWSKKNNRVQGAVEMDPDTKIKIIRKGCIRLVSDGPDDDDKVSVYHNLDNARVWHGRDPQWVEISCDSAPAVEYLLHAYPNYVPVVDLPLETLDEKLEIAVTLYENGLLMTSEPLALVDEDDVSRSDVISSEEEEDNSQKHPLPPKVKKTKL